MWYGMVHTYILLVDTRIVKKIEHVDCDSAISTAVGKFPGLSRYRSSEAYSVIGKMSMHVAYKAYDWSWCLLSFEKLFCFSEKFLLTLEECGELAKEIIIQQRT